MTMAEILDDTGLRRAVLTLLVLWMLSTAGTTAALVWFHTPASCPNGLKRVSVEVFTRGGDAGFEQVSVCALPDQVQSEHESSD